jgi:hypothetical protein
VKFPLPRADYQWQSISRMALICWIAFYFLFLVHALRSVDGYLWIDNANLVTHESGHLLFGWFGPTLGLWGGTLMQLLVPLALAISFAWRGHTAGTAFCAFFFFENFLGIARYMADARVQLLPLVTVGDSGEEGVMHDWFQIFSSLNVLEYDTKIAVVVRTLGWLGMIAVVGWFLLMGLRSCAAAEKAQSARA